MPVYVYVPHSLSACHMNDRQSQRAAVMAASCQLELIIALCSEQITFRFPFSFPFCLVVIFLSITHTHIHIYVLPFRPPSSALCNCLCRNRLRSARKMCSTAKSFINILCKRRAWDSRLAFAIEYWLFYES